MASKTIGFDLWQKTWPCQTWPCQTWPYQTLALSSRVESEHVRESRNHSLLARRNAGWREGYRSALRDVSAGRYFHPRLRARDGFRQTSPAPHYSDLHQLAAAREQDVQDVSSADAACARTAR